LVFIALLAVTDAASRLVRMRLNRTANRKPRTLAPGEKSSAWSRITSKRWLVSVLVLLMFAGCFPVAGFSFAAFTSTGMFGRVGMFVQHMLPPDWSWAFMQGLGTALLQTIAISLLGTLIGLALAVVLALPATSTLVFLPRESPGQASILERIVRWFLFWSARLVLNVLRSIPELVWVLICILAVGVGPFAGTIALGLHTAGVLGKLYAETMEEVLVRPIEALRSLGARPLQILLWAIWPQARPLLSSYTVLRWEMNLRASTILGLVGGGGLGQAIYNNVQLGFYSRLSTLIVVIYALVLTSDWIGERFRLKVA
jgi:phosphonate transport system permease protein